MKVSLELPNLLKYLLETTAILRSKYKLCSCSEVDDNLNILNKQIKNILRCEPDEWVAMGRAEIASFPQKWKKLQSRENAITYALSTRFEMPWSKQHAAQKLEPYLSNINKSAGMQFADV